VQCSTTEKWFLNVRFGNTGEEVPLLVRQTLDEKSDPNTTEREKRLPIGGFWAVWRETSIRGGTINSGSATGTKKPYP